MRGSRRDSGPVFVHSPQRRVGFSTVRKLCSDGGGGGLLAWGHVLDVGSADTTCGWCHGAACGGAVHGVFVGSVGPACWGADVVDDPGGAAGGVGGAAQAAGAVGGAGAAGAGAGRPRRRGCGHRVRRRRRRGWRTRRTTSRTAAFADLHLARKLDDRFDATRRALGGRGDRRGEGAGGHRRGGGARPASTTTSRPGPARRAEAHMLDLATEFDAPTLRRLGKRLFEVVCPEAADAAEGRKLAKEEARRGRWRTSRSATTATAPAPGRFRLPTLHADLLKKALEALTVAAAARGGPAGPGHREEAAARHPARPGSDGAGREPPQ